MSGCGCAPATVTDGKACYQCGSRDHLVSFHKHNATSGVGRGQRDTGYFTHFTVGRPALRACGVLAADWPAQ